MLNTRLYLYALCCFVCMGCSQKKLSPTNKTKHKRPVQACSDNPKIFLATHHKLTKNANQSRPYTGLDWFVGLPGNLKKIDSDQLLENAKTDMEGNAYLELTPAQQKIANIPIVSSVWVYVGSVACKMHIEKIYLHNSNSEDHPRFVGQLAGDCAKLNDKQNQHNSLTVVSALAVHPSCTFQSHMVNVNPDKINIKWPLAVAKIIDNTPCKPPACKSYLEMNEVEMAGMTLYTIQSARVKFNKDAQKQIEHIQANKKTTAIDKAISVDDIACEQGVERHWATVWHAGKDKPLQRLFSHKDLGYQRPKLHGWLTDARGVQTIIFEETGEVVVFQRRGQSFTKIQEYRRYTPHINDGYPTLGVDCTP